MWKIAVRKKMYLCMSGRCLNYIEIGNHTKKFHVQKLCNNDDNLLVWMAH